MSLTVMIKNVNAALKAKVWTFEAKAIRPKAKAIKFGLEATLSPRLASRCLEATPLPRLASWCLEGLASSTTSLHHN